MSKRLNLAILGSGRLVNGQSGHGSGGGRSGTQASGPASRPSSAAASARTDDAVPAAVGPRPVVTRQIVDEAVEMCLAKLDATAEDKAMLRNVLASDPSADFAASYHQDKVRLRTDLPTLQRRRIAIPYVLSAEQVAVLSTYAREFDLVFGESAEHDHAMAASMRKIDTEILFSRLPANAKIKDIGGDPILHITRDTFDVHLCNPEVDVKDPSRDSMHRLRALRMLEKGGLSPTARDKAQRYLRGDTSFVCKERAQECGVQARISVSVHVYDIPIEDWPVIMERAGVQVHEGVILYPRAGYVQSKGEMDHVEARYSIDLESDEYAMGFRGSPAWWYQHQWSDLVKYGTDQTLYYNGHRYAYKVVERRGDSVFFRVLRLAGPVKTPERQYYELPGCEMVRVEGFSYDSTARYHTKAGPVITARRQPSYFPKRLWDDMFREACLRFERDDLSFDKMYNYYRTMAARHTINGVLVSGGQKVSLHEVSDLIVRVCMCAAATVMLEKRTTWLVTNAAVRERAWRMQSGLAKVMSSFAEGMSRVAAGLMYYPLGWVCDKVLSRFGEASVEELTSWAEVPRIQEVPFSALVSPGLIDRCYGWLRGPLAPTQPLLDDVYSSDMGPWDYMRMLEFSPDLLKLVAGEGGASTTKGGDVGGSGVGGAGVGLPPTASATVVEPEVESVIDPDRTKRRRMAIQECIDESNMEAKKILSTCAMVWSACTTGIGLPVERVLRARAEEFYSPDFWYVNAGVITRSVLGLQGKECKYSALYTRMQDRTTESHFHTVFDEHTEEEEYRVLGSSTYTGWALSIDRLLIYNGPEIVKTLTAALGVPHDYEITLFQGPPGCGKTFDLISKLALRDVAMCPVRESALDTRAQVVERRADFPEPRYRVCTCDSYCVNRDKRPQLEVGVLHGDECFMAHSGKWYAIAGLLGVTKVYMYGDVKQIPHVSRVQANNMYARVSPDKVVEKFDTYRCPADAVAAWGHVYDWRVRTHSTVKLSLSVAVDAKAQAVPYGCVLMSFYQADKAQIKKLLGPLLKTRALRIMSVHESEGKTFDHVWLFRFDTRKREDGMSLYDKQDYVLVAMSRHRKSFTYVRPRNLGDLVDTWIEASKDLRAVNRALDLASVGQAKRWL